MITRLAHVCLNVKNLQTSVNFYGKLGFTSKFSFTREGKLFGAYLQVAADQFIEMFEDPNLRSPRNEGIAHFCLESTDIPALMAELDAKGIPYTPNRIGCDHTWQIWLKDPDGNAFEVHQYTERSLQLHGGNVEADW